MAGYILDYQKPVDLLEATSEGIIIRINGYPVPWKSPRVSKFGTYAPHGDIKKYLKRKIGLLYNGPKLKNAVTCDLTFYFPVTKTDWKKLEKMRDSGKPIYHTKKPDRINLGKFAEDLLEGSILKNDSQIVDGNVRKEYTFKNPCTLISLFIH